MTELIIWKNQEMSKLRRDMERLVDRFCTNFGVPCFYSEGADIFSMDLSETNDTLILKAELPGMHPDDLDISVAENELTIKGESRLQNTQENGRSYRIESSTRSFSRTISLPCRVRASEVEATFKNDVLMITLPKCAPNEAHGIRVEVK